MKISLLIMSCALLSLQAFAQKDVTPAQWQNTPPKIDGNAGEWKKPFANIDGTSKIEYVISNDQNNLYVCLQNPDTRNQVKMMRAGMKLTFSAKEKKNKLEASVNFPLEQLGDPAPAQSGDGKRQRPDPKQMHDRFLLTNTSMNIEGFTGRSGNIPAKDTSGLTAAINWDTTNVMIYELAVPFKLLFGKNFKFNELPKEITMEVEIHPLEKPQRQGDSENSDSGYGGGGHRGGGGSGRMGGGGGRHGGGGGYGRGGQGGEGGSLFEKTTFKHKFTLASRA